MAELTRQQLEDLATSTNIPDNTTELIDPAEVRNQYANERDSVINKLDDGVEAIENNGKKILTYTVPAVLSELTDNDLVSLSVLKELLDTPPYWAQYSDTQYTTEGTALSIADQQTIAIPNNAGSVINTFMPSGVVFYDGTKITPRKLGANYLLRINFMARSTTVQNYINIKLDIGGTQGVILEKVETFPRGANINQAFSATTSIYSLGTFLANGGNLTIYADDPASIWGVSYVITEIK